MGVLFEQSCKCQLRSAATEKCIKVFKFKVGVCQNNLFSDGHQNPQHVW